MPRTRTYTETEGTGSLQAGEEVRGERRTRQEEARRKKEERRTRQEEVRRKKEVRKTGGGEGGEKDKTGGGEEGEKDKTGGGEEEEGRGQEGRRRRDEETRNK